MELDWSDEHATLSVHRAQAHPQPDATELAELAEIIAEFPVVTARGDRATVLISLPIRRSRQRKLELPMPDPNALPSPEEADEDGAFGKEAFLRALAERRGQGSPAVTNPTDDRPFGSRTGEGVPASLVLAFASPIRGILTPSLCLWEHHVW